MSRSKLHFLPDNQMRGGLLYWVIGIMVFLSGMAIVAGMQLGAIAEGWRDSASRSFTVQIMETDRDERRTQIDAALEVLNAMPGINPRVDFRSTVGSCSLTMMSLLRAMRLNHCLLN